MLLQGLIEHIKGRYNKVMSESIKKNDLVSPKNKPVSIYAQEMAAMDHKINRLERYIQILADNADIDLDKIRA